MVSVQTHLDQLVVRVKQVEHCVCIGLLTGCEHDHIEVLPSFSQAFEGERPDVDPSINGFRFIIELDTDDVLRALLLYVVHTVDQSFIHVKHYEPLATERNINRFTLCVLRHRD